MDIEKLHSALRRAWCRETSVDPEGWSNENPSWGINEVLP